MWGILKENIQKGQLLDWGCKYFLSTPTFFLPNFL